MSYLTLEEAAKYVGLPPHVLHAHAWAKKIKTDGSLWAPRFTEADLTAWMSVNGGEKDRAPAPKSPHVAGQLRKVKMRSRCL